MCMNGIVVTMFFKMGNGHGREVAIFTITALD